MIELQIEGLTVDDFLYILKTRKFKMNEYEEYIQKFFHYFEDSVRNKVIDEIIQNTKLEDLEECRCLRERFLQTMENMDEVILKRSAIMYRIAARNKHNKKKNGNTKRKSLND